MAFVCSQCGEKFKVTHIPALIDPCPTHPLDYVLFTNRCPKCGSVRIRPWTWRDRLGTGYIQYEERWRKREQREKERKEKEGSDDASIFFM
ncbi:MAG: hypothetical protein IKH14_04120 [Prevotella sp.]|nr:hypothetical protein [Prevotella sp.]